jgi:hypothetical protein
VALTLIVLVTPKSYLWKLTMIIHGPLESSPKCHLSLPRKKTDREVGKLSLDF